MSEKDETRKKPKIDKPKTVKVDKKNFTRPPTPKPGIDYPVFP